MPSATQSARFGAASAQRFAWRHPEWWSLAFSIAAWIALLSTPRHSPSHRSTTVNMVWWLLMVVAMMFPLVVAQVRQAAFHSLWRRRHRAIGFFLTGYVVPWLAFGALVIVIQGAWSVDPRWSAIVGILVAAAWHFSPLKRRALRHCHQVVPLAPLGWRANWGCVTFGWRIGAACVGACWALMMACAITDHSMVTMSVATLVAGRDRIG